jgi:hypothetical protein
VSTASFPYSLTLPQQTQYSYVTQTSLLAAPVQSPSVPITLDNPDAPITTLSLIAPSNSPTGPVSVAPLPSDLPARIYPRERLDETQLNGESLVALLLDLHLSWQFVVENSQSQGQLFLWTPGVLATALGIPIDRVNVFALQVEVTAAYTGPSDAGMLRTMILLYIPTEMVSVLQNQLRTSNSPLYTILRPPYSDLASHFDKSFVITSVDANALPGTPNVAGLRKNNSRRDAIIGVVSALGGLAFIILGVLVFRSVKRSRELRHRRLLDPNMPNDPYPDRTGRDFDQDSVGGQRRRSFYFAEDSLRGQQPPAVQVVQAQTEHVLHPGYQTEYSYRTSPESMRERRVPVVPGAISAPILTQSSLNW